MPRPLRAICSTTLALLIFALASTTRATETEHYVLQILPAPGPVVVDGKTNDWDLTGGIFACGDAETQRDKFATWLHAMYDANGLYILARWVDDTPLNNPGRAAGDFGFAGDCLQLRLITHPETPDERCAHLTCWRDRDGIDVIDAEFGRKFDQGKIRNAKTQGAQQAFSINPDGKGYVQEMFLPWKIMTRDGQPLKPGDSIRVTVEPNFTVGTHGRLTNKDLFKSAGSLDRVFTFMSSPQWGSGILAAKGNMAPLAVHLSDGRDFPVRMEAGLPVVNWAGLIKSKELAGFKPIAFDMPEDGYISMNIRSADGRVVRQLLACDFRAKGHYEVKWDGLTTPSWRRPGEAVSPGAYSWDAIWHKGIGLRLKGWACNGGSAPWDGATGKENWGGDHGLPAACASDGQKTYLAWNGAEAGKALLAVDADGNVQWSNVRGGIGGASLVAVDAGVVYAYNGNSKAIYRVAPAKGDYTSWAGTDSTDLFIKSLWDDAAKPPEPSGIAAGGGTLYVSFSANGVVMVLDGASGKVLNKLDVKSPSALQIGADGKLYVISGSSAVVCLTGSLASRVVEGLTNATGLALDKQGRLYVGVRDPDNQVKIFTPDGKPAGTIGRAGGRAKLGPWQPDGMLFIHGMTVDAHDRLWVMEEDGHPKRVSAWDIKTGKLYKEFFGPSSYGALGGAINPVDPNLMIGQGCEWRIDPATGKAICLGTITRDGMEVSRFATGSNGRLYLAVATGWAYDALPVRIFERLGDANYKLRASFRYEGKDKTGKTIYWADRNGDGQEQADEVTSIDGHLRFSGWYMGLGPDMTIYADGKMLKTASFTACGAPIYDLAAPRSCPPRPSGPSAGSAPPTPGSSSTTARTASITASSSATTSPAATRSGPIPTISSASTARTTPPGHKSA